MSKLVLTRSLKLKCRRFSSQVDLELLFQVNLLSDSTRYANLTLLGFEIQYELENSDSPGPVGKIKIDRSPVSEKEKWGAKLGKSGGKFS